MGKALLFKHGCNDKQKFILNLSSNRYSTPGYLKLGLKYIEDTDKYISYGLRALVNYFLTTRFRLEYFNDTAKYGVFGDIEISKYPKPKEMYEISKSQEKQSNIISLCKDLAFFQWRFERPKAGYTFYCYRQDDVIKDYMVTRRNKNNLSIERVVDYSFNNKNGIKQLLHYVTKNNKNRIIRVIDALQNKEFCKVIDELKFKHTDKDLLLRFYKRLKDSGTQLPSILIRPIKPNYDESGWLLENINTRMIKNWEINDICLDTV